MVQWATFAGVTGVVLVLLLVLSHLTQSAFDDADSEARETDSIGSELDSSPTADIDGAADVAGATDSRRGDTDSRQSREYDQQGDDGDPTRPIETDRPRSPEPDPREPTAAEPPEPTESEPAQPTESEPAQPTKVDPRSLSTGELLANVALSQGLFAGVLLGAVVYTGIPADALGIEFSQSYLEQGLVLGTIFGVGLYVANEIGAAVATRFGFDHDEELRGLLAPETGRGWLLLLLVVLPIIAIFEELLFRAAMIGVIAAGFGVSPWLLAVISSVAFAVGHGMQGSVGVVVTGLLGFVLAAIYILTGSFLVVVVAHYLINALEFVVHEGLEIEWAETLES